ncbi:MAG: AAC(3)-I family aminoglycoside N-acetyltransferase [Polyangiaceae bacterium]|nr:AAC(3)-I family aminoglycoside N-acetyltransferase [Polyangiaceae bacterium]
MNQPTPFNICQLGANDLNLMEGLVTMFGQAFDDLETYTGKRPSAEYTTRLLGRDTFIALAALIDGEVVGGLAAYELHKFEQERSEIYLYDLAVSAEHRRRGIATALIEKLREIAAQRGAWVIFVQADTDEDDKPAQALYSRLGEREEVLHFDIPVGEK